MPANNLTVERCFLPFLFLLFYICFFFVSVGQLGISILPFMSISLLKSSFVSEYIPNYGGYSDSQLACTSFDGQHSFIKRMWRNDSLLIALVFKRLQE